MARAAEEPHGERGFIREDTQALHELAERGGRWVGVSEREGRIMFLRRVAITEIQYKMKPNSTPPTYLVVVVVN